MRAGRKQAVFIITVILAVCSYTFGVYRMQGLDEKMTSISFVANGEECLRVPQDETRISGTFWKEMEECPVVNKSLYRTVMTTVIALHGRSDVLFPNTAVIDTGSTKSCLLSSELAYELFGEADVKGLEVVYQEKAYRVAGIIEREEKLFVYEPSAAEMMQYNRLTTENPEERAVNVVEQELQMKYGNGRILDYSMPKLFLELGFFLIFLLVSIMTLRLVKRCGNGNENFREKLIWNGIYAAIIIIVVFFAVKTITIPKDMIPEKWSDFEFWTEWMKYKKDAMNFLIRVQKTSIDMELWKEYMFMKRLIGMLLAVVLFCVGCSTAGGEEPPEGAKKGKDRKVIQVYSLHENSDLIDAVNGFMDKYPEYLVRIQIGISENDGITESDAIRNLNTEVMAGKGPDVMFLDGLPVDAYIEKGILADLSEVIEQSKSKGEKFFENVLTAYQKNGKAYAIPSYFGIPLLFGSDSILQAGNTHELTELIVSKADDAVPVIGEEIEKIVALSLLTSWNEMFQKNQKVDRAELTVLLEDIKKITETAGFDKDLPEYEEDPPFEQIIEAYPYYEGMGTSVAWGDTQMSVGTLTTVRELSGYQSVYRERAVLHNYLSWKNGKIFFPQRILGVTASSKNREGALAFTEWFLSDDHMGKSTHYSYICVNKTGVEKNMVDGRLRPGETIGKKGKTSSGWDIVDEIPLRDLSEDERQKFIGFFDEADTMVNPDPVVFETVVLQLKRYIYGEETLENVVNEIGEKVEIYQAE